MWILPLIVIGLVVYAASSNRDPAPTSRQLSAPQFVPPPGPIAVLGELLRIGQEPPPPVIMCAIAEAESIGRNDLASDIVTTFVAPVVYRHELERARNAKALAPAPVSAPAPARPRAYEPARTAAPTPVSAPAPARGERAASCFPTRSTTTAQPALQSRQGKLEELGAFPATDEEIRAMLNADPERFLAMARKGPVVSNRAPAVAQPIPVEMKTPELVVPAKIDQIPAIAAPRAPSSPVKDVAPADWTKFRALLARESPGFRSSRHVGQYRQRVDRLAELGIDPVTLLDSPDAQLAAVDVDLADAAHHARESGLIAQHVNRTIVVPGSDPTGDTITMSGLLGVIQAAGLDGAVGWFESKRDRTKYPHTTAAFLKTNGVF